MLTQRRTLTANMSGVLYANACVGGGGCFGDGGVSSDYGAYGTTSMPWSPTVGCEGDGGGGDGGE